MENNEKFLDKIADFLVEANNYGYAAEAKEKKESDHSNTIEYRSGDWRYQDNYFGGEPYGGREVVFYKDQPVYMMVYYGWVGLEVNANKIYPFLRKSLLVRQKENPYRGPKLFEEGTMKYVNSWTGGVSNFSGEEKIFDGETCVYTAKYIGGLIDQKRPY